jgi:TetR/AcrR family transcriptional regulator
LSSDAHPLGRTGRSPRPATVARRRKQIVDVVVKLIDEHGVQGATTARIAAGAGVSEPTLYVYFENRRDMLLAALDAVFDGAEAVVYSSRETDAVERLRNIGRYHTQRTKAKSLGFVNPLFEFVVAPPEAGLRDRVRERSLLIIEEISKIVEEGKTQGRIRPDVDSKRIAWRIMGFYWFEDVSSLMDLPEVVDEGISEEMFDAILRSAVVKEPLQVSSS